MRLRIIHILIQTILGLCLFLCPVHAEGVPSNDEMSLFGLINQARENPLGMAVYLGMDAENIIKDLPELEDILINGLPPLLMNSSLFEAASLHSQDMIAGNYYSHTSADGRTPEDRILASGYYAAVSGESLGIVGFNNFIEPSCAVQVIFEKMFKRELEITCVERNILNPEITDAGVGLGTGILNLNNMLLNAYVATCSFGTPVDNSAVEAGIWRIVNEIRNEPVQALALLETDEETLEEDFGDQAWLLTTRHPPLAWSHELNEAAAAQCLDMNDNGILGPEDIITLPDDQNLHEAVRGTGYDPLYVRATLAILEFRSGNSTDISRYIYESILKKEFSPEAEIDINLLDPNFTEIGIAVNTMAIEAEAGDIHYVYAVAAVFAIPVEQRFFMVGRVYRDTNANDVPDPGEGMPGLEVSLKTMFTGPEEPAAVTETGLYGDYQIPLTGVFMELSVSRDGEVLETSFVGGGQSRNVFRDFVLFP